MTFHDALREGRRHPPHPSPRTGIRGLKRAARSSGTGRALEQRMTEGGFQIGERLRLGLDLDGCHAHGAGRLEVDAEIVEEDAGLPAPRPAARRRGGRRRAPACARPASRDSTTASNSAIASAISRARGPSSSGRAHIVGEAGGPVAGRDRPERRHHARPHRALDEVEDFAGVQPVAERRRLGLEAPAEFAARSISLRSNSAQALLSGLRLLMRRTAPFRQAAGALVAGKGVEGAFRQHAAEIPEHRLYRSRRASLAAGRAQSGLFGGRGPGLPAAGLPPPPAPPPSSP